MTPEAQGRQLTDSVFKELDSLTGPSRRLALAVSGGSDSTALLFICSAWAVERQKTLVVLTVDHGLRSEAAEEARAVAETARSLSLDHHTLLWSAPRADAQRARKARHQLLARAAKRLNVQDILFGHTLDDQFETFLIRQKQGSDDFGLGGMDRMAPSPVWPAGRGLRLVRPLLSVRRQALREWLNNEQRRWIEDPTNTDASYERVRVRNALNVDPDLRAQTEQQFRECAEGRRLELRARAAVLRERVSFTPASEVIFDPSGVAIRRAAAVLGILIQVAAGHDRQLRRQKLEDLIAAFFSQALNKSVTYGGAWLQRCGDRLVIGRDPGAVPTDGILEDGVWDGRFEPGGGQHPHAEFSLQKSTLPPPGPGWRALARGRLTHICDIWCQA